MIAPDDWERLIADAVRQSNPTVRAHTYRREWPSASKPRQFICDDGHDYVVKGSHFKRTVVNDHLVGWLGRAIDAPVPELALIEVPEELVRLEPKISPITAGVHHGSRYIHGTRDDRENLAAIALDVNRDRFAALAVLYGWTHARDHQVIYLKEDPQLVFSVDHGHFFPNGPNWTIDGLNASGTAVPDETVILRCGLAENDVQSACSRLLSVTPATIAGAIARVPDEWWNELSERLAMAVYLERRRQALLIHFGLE